MPDTHLEERIAALEGSYREITKHIDHLRSETHRGFDGVRTEMIRMNDRMESMFRWTMSMILVNWLSLPAGISGGPQKIVPQPTPAARPGA